MSCNRQNIRPTVRPVRPNSCVTGTGINNCVVPLSAPDGCDSDCGTRGVIVTDGCNVQGGIITGNSAGNGCGAPCANTLLEELPLGMAYVPWQSYGTMYPLQQGWRRGTMFPSLDFDFMGRRCN